MRHNTHLAILWILTTKYPRNDSIFMKVDLSAYDLTICVSIYINPIFKQID